ncbi:hypothetical protein GCM10023340_30140 [Nocardioides marinquilinus]|uniref:DUF308 domain-containing protein n=1 Tax=Nocardioides marinquilinus TaxID=1210400 RepID=A0ABP9PSD2_9ACTN
MGQRDEDDEVWRAIVDNYGDRAQIDADPTQSTAPETATPSEPSEPSQPSEPAQPVVRRDPERAPDGPPDASRRSWDDEFVDSDWTTDRFVPPPPPPLPTPPHDRMAAWAGVFGSPAVLLGCLVLGIGIPALLAYLLVAAFVGGFVYLVVKMDRQPRDPGDDGAVL